MINNLLEDDFEVYCVSLEKFLEITKGIEKQVKGKSDYEDRCLISYLPKNKEFYVIEDYEEPDIFTGDYMVGFEIAFKHNNIHYVCGGCGRC